MLTRKQHELLCFIDTEIARTGISPSFEEMKDALDLKSKSGIHRLVSALEERQFVRRLPNRARAMEVLRRPTDLDPGHQVMAPKAHGIAATGGTIRIPLFEYDGTANPSAQSVGKMIDVPASMLRKGEHFAFRMAGSTMMEAGILDGDLLLLRRGAITGEGKTALVVVDEKTPLVRVVSYEGDEVRLDPANHSYDPIRRPTENVRVLGILVGLLRIYA